MRPISYRQELVRRGAFDLDEDKVNFKAMLQRLMTELVAEESREAELKTKAADEAVAAKFEAAKQERERKKQEALERSRQRQADPEYFKKRTEENEALAAKEKARVEAVAALEAQQSVQEDEGEGSDGESGDANDPFRTYKSKGRSKVFVK
jgi:uncharacterized protein YdiU (UPF0061 family)